MAPVSILDHKAWFKKASGDLKATRVLLNECISIDFSFVQITSLVSALNGFSTYARYPDDSFSIDYTEANEAYKKALFIINFVKQRIPL